MTEIEAKVKYVKLARSLQTYGVSFFLVKVRPSTEETFTSHQCCPLVPKLVYVASIDLPNSAFPTKLKQKKINILFIQAVIFEMHFSTHPLCLSVKSSLWYNEPKFLNVKTLSAAADPVQAVAYCSDLPIPAPWCGSCNNYDCYKTGPAAQPCQVSTQHRWDSSVNAQLEHLEAVWHLKFQVFRRRLRGSWGISGLLGWSELTLTFVDLFPRTCPACCETRCSKQVINPIKGNIGDF